MNKPLSLGLLVVGLVLLVLGWNASESFASEFSEFFTGSPTNKTMWLFLGGALLAIVGLAGLARSSGR